MDLNYFDYDLPVRLIAHNPVNPRSSSRLLVSRTNRIVDAGFMDLPSFLNEGDLLVINNTKVFPALLVGHKMKSDPFSADTVPGARISLNLDSQNRNGIWSCLGKPMKKLRVDDVVRFGMHIEGKIIRIDGRWCEVEFNLQGEDFFREVQAIGHTPLPGYITAKRPELPADQTDYQSYFARHAGAVAAPTASLHFDEKIVSRLLHKGIKFTELTLHVGAGTFLPMTSDRISDHKIHGEWGSITQSAVDEILTAKRKNRRVIAVGTTSLRLIETAAREGRIEAWEGVTDLYITPGFAFQVADGLLTNFHLPKSSLLVLVAAFVGGKKMKEIYHHALHEEYRFLSYGDSSLLLNSS